MNAEPLWQSVDDVIALHDEQLAIFGGLQGLRDRGLLESALARPIHRWSYGETDLAVLAASYGFGLAKKTILSAMATNGLRSRQSS